MKIFLMACMLALSAAPSWAGVDLDALRKAVQKQDIVALNGLQLQFKGTALEMYPDYYALTAQIGMVSEQHIAAFLNRYADTFLANKLRNIWLKELARRQEWDSYRIEYAALTKPDNEQVCNFIKAELAQNEVRALFNQTALWFSAKAQPDACNAVFDAMFNAGILTEEHAWQRVRLALAIGRVDFAGQIAAKRIAPAVATQIKLVAHSPHTQLAALPLATRMGQELAIFALNRIARINPNHAADWLMRYQQALPSTIAAVAWGQIGWIAAQKLSPQALQWYKRSDIKRLTSQERSWMARMAIRQDEWQMVCQAIETMPKAERQLPIWQYWYARALQATEHIDKAKPIFNALMDDTGYYGLLAREELGNVLEAMPDAFTPSYAQIEKIKSHPGIQRALAFYPHPDWHKEATWEWNGAMQNLSDEALLTASALAYQIGWYDRAIYAAEKTRQTHNYSMRFPLPVSYKNDINQSALAQGIDPAWVYGLIRQESRFAPLARSTQGAAGLMQIMPATAKWIAGRIGIKGFDWRSVHYPLKNIQFGTYYLRYVLNLLEGNSVLATAGYNAGPNRPKQWLANRSLEGAKWVETIPFDETRDYVKKVLANAIHYGQQINRRSSLLKQRLGLVPARQESIEKIKETNQLY
jgi:soluble lytic murein transglycosylase